MFVKGFMFFWPYSMTSRLVSMDVDVETGKVKGAFSSSVLTVCSEIKSPCQDTDMGFVF